jgi:4-hydroxy-3-methylbut-2-enyl diphosphate reductase
MEIIITKNAGFCFGVKRAVKIATECAKAASGSSASGSSANGSPANGSPVNGGISEGKKKATKSVGGNIYTLGPIIHNPQVVENLSEDLGIHPKSSIDEMDNGTIIIRSHGVKLEDLSAAEKKGLKILDATCPFVKKTQSLVSELARDGYLVVVVGEKEHPEVQGILSYGKGHVMVAASPEELSELKPTRKIGIVAQTTQSEKNLQAVMAFCLSKTVELKVFNTRCNATEIRQDESIDLASRVDAVFVIGGRNSANTKRLAELCSEIQPRTHHIEVASEIKAEWLEGVKKLGITAGASTPNWIIEEIIKRAIKLSS